MHALFAADRARKQDSVHATSEEQPGDPCTKQQMCQLLPPVLPDTSAAMHMSDQTCTLLHPSIFPCNLKSQGLKSPTSIKTLLFMKNR